MKGRQTILGLAVLLALGGCSQRRVSDAGEVGEAGGTAVAEWSPCAYKGEVSSCAELCAAQGMACHESACPADPEFCDPEPCDMATRVMGLGEGICEDHSGGGYFADACDAPIEWLFSNTVRCCCGEED